jgi:hypothetical protein
MWALQLGVGPTPGALPLAPAPQLRSYRPRQIALRIPVGWVHLSSHPDEAPDRLAGQLYCGRGDRPHQTYPAPPSGALVGERRTTTSTSQAPMLRCSWPAFASGSDNPQRRQRKGSPGPHPGVLLFGAAIRPRYSSNPSCYSYLTPYLTLIPTIRRTQFAIRSENAGVLRRYSSNLICYSARDSSNPICYSPAIRPRYSALSNLLFAELKFAICPRIARRLLPALVRRPGNGAARELHPA